MSMHSQEARKKLLEEILNSTDLDVMIRLTQNAAAHTDELTVLADFVEATFVGYAAVPTAGGVTASINGALEAETGQQTYIFTADAGITGPQSIYGAYATYTSFAGGTKLLWHGFFGSAKVVEFDDDEIRIKIDWFEQNLVP